MNPFEVETKTRAINHMRRIAGIGEIEFGDIFKITEAQLETEMALAETWSGMTYDPNGRYEYSDRVQRAFAKFDKPKNERF